jgi:CheY-like chemotaxis protein
MLDAGPGLHGGLVSLRILVVDDSDAFRHTVRDLLTARGLVVCAAVADGTAALDAVGGRCPDGALVDVNLAGQDGFAVAASLAAACSGMRVVLISSDLDGVPATVLRGCGAVAFIPKTDLVAADLELLFTTVEESEVQDRR